MPHAAHRPGQTRAIPDARTAALARRPNRRIARLRAVRRNQFVGWLFVLPALSFYAVFVLQPLVLTVQYSLYRWDGVDGKYEKYFSEAPGEGD